MEEAEARCFDKACAPVEDPFREDGRTEMSHRNERPVEDPFRDPMILGGVAFGFAARRGLRPIYHRSNACFFGRLGKVSCGLKDARLEGKDKVGAPNALKGAAVFRTRPGSAEQFIAEANAVAFHRLLTMLETETARKSAANAIEIIVSLYLSQTQVKQSQYFCPLSMLGAELSHGDPQVRAIAIAGYQALVRLIADRLTQLSKAKALTTASGIVSTMVGAVTLAGIAPDKRAAQTILSAAKTLIEARL